MDEEAYKEIIKAKDKEIEDLKRIIDTLTKKPSNPYMEIPSPNWLKYTETTY